MGAHVLLSFHGLVEGLPLDQEQGDLLGDLHVQALVELLDVDEEGMALAVVHDRRVEALEAELPPVLEGDVRRVSGLHANGGPWFGQP